MISSRGLREGLALGDHPSIPTPREVRSISVATLASRFATWDAVAAARRGALAAQLIEALDPEATASVKEILAHASYLLDIGKAIDHYERWEHTAMIVTTADLAGFSHSGLAALSAILLHAGEHTSFGPYARIDPSRRAPRAPARGGRPRPRRGAASADPRRRARDDHVHAAARPRRGHGSRSGRLAAEDDPRPLPGRVRREALDRPGARASAPSIADRRRLRRGPPGQLLGSTRPSGRGAAGNEISNVVPRPSSLSTSIVPPWFSTTCFTIASPSPVPPVSLERARSTR